VRGYARDCSREAATCCCHAVELRNGVVGFIEKKKTFYGMRGKHSIPDSDVDLRPSKTARKSPILSENGVPSKLSPVSLPLSSLHDLGNGLCDEGKASSILPPPPCFYEIKGDKSEEEFRALVSRSDSLAHWNLVPHFWGSHAGPERETEQNNKRMIMSPSDTTNQRRHWIFRVGASCLTCILIVGTFSVAISGILNVGSFFHTKEEDGCAAKSFSCGHLGIVRDDARVGVFIRAAVTDKNLNFAKVLVFRAAICVVVLWVLRKLWRVRGRSLLVGLEYAYLHWLYRPLIFNPRVRRVRDYVDQVSCLVKKPTHYISHVFLVCVRVFFSSVPAPNWIANIG
jgi:hypothetical protein